MSVLTPWGWGVFPFRDGRQIGPRPHVCPLPWAQPHAWTLSAETLLFQPCETENQSLPHDTPSSPSNGLEKYLETPCPYFPTTQKEEETPTSSSNPETQMIVN